MSLDEQFRQAHPKAIDFPQVEFEADKQAYYDAAARNGYRIAGLRLQRAVFTTKPPLAPDAQKEM